MQRRLSTSAPVAPLDAFRWVNGTGDGAPPGLVLDRYGDTLILSVRPEVPPPVIDAWLAACVEHLMPMGIVHKTVTRQASDRQSRVVYGRVPAGPVRVREGDATFECLMNDGLQTGLFLDHRDTRLLIRKWSKDIEVLNLFAYTGAFSVHAALAGASRVTSVDSARRALRWGRDNMRATGLDPDRHRWFPDDVVAHLRRGPIGQYGLVVLDPPVLGRAGGKTFSLDQQIDALLEGAIRKLAVDGVLVFSTHARRWSVEALRPRVESAALAAGRRVEWRAELGLPDWDHPTGDESQGQDRGDYLKTLVLQFG